MHYDNIEEYALWLLQFHNREDIMLREVAFQADMLLNVLAGKSISNEVSEQYARLDNAMQTYKLLMNNEVQALQAKSLIKGK